MSRLKSILDFYIFGNIHVALATFCLTKITLLAYDISSDILPWFIFLSTFISYNFIRIYQFNELQDWFREFIKGHKKLLFILSILSTIILSYTAFQFKLKTLLALIPFALFTFFYVIPLNLSSKSALSLRSISLFKLFLIALAWAGVTVLVPLVKYEIEFSRNEIIMFMQRFVFIVAITIPFDIRDMNFDNEKLRTLPQVYGIKTAKRIGMFCLMVFVGFEIFKETVSPQDLTVKLIVALISLIFLLKSTSHQDNYYSAFFVESIPIIWFGMIWFFN